MTKDNEITPKDVREWLDALSTQYEFRASAILPRASSDAPSVQQLGLIREAHLGIASILQAYLQLHTENEKLKGEIENHIEARAALASDLNLVNKKYATLKAEREGLIEKAYKEGYSEAVYEFAELPKAALQHAIQRDWEQSEAKSRLTQPQKQEGV